MKFIAFIDNSLNSGAGHVKRSLNLTFSYIEAHKVDELIIIFEDKIEKYLINKINNFNIPKKTILEKYDNKKINDIDFDYKDNFVLIDSYKINDNFLKAIKKKIKNVKILRIIDSPIFSSADYIVDYNPLAIDKWREISYNKESHYLLGLKYFISNFEKKFLNEIGSKYESDILICFGYSPQPEVIKNCLLSIKKLKDLARKKILIVTNYSEEISNLLKEEFLSFNISIKNNVNNLIPYINNSKIFISSSSTQMYEASFLRVPTICIELNNNQKNTSQLYDELGLWFYIPNKELNSIKKFLGKLLLMMLNNYDDIVNESWGSNQINLNGQKNIILDISNKNFKNKILTSKTLEGRVANTKTTDLDFKLKYMNSYLDLRNIKSNRTVMVNKQVIKRLEHYCWWLSNPPRNSKLLIREEKQKIIIWEQSIKIENDLYLIGGWFGNNYPRKFWDAFFLVKEQLENCKLKYPNHTWLAIIHKQNENVLKMNFKLGFEEIEFNNKNNYETIFKKAFKLRSFSSFNKLIFKNNV